jgi:dipeptidyl aminopeptidase/acylaminoacyl peptidase
LTRVIGGPRVVDAFSIDPNGAVAALVGEPLLPEEVFLLEGEDLRQMTKHNKEFFSQIQLGGVEKIRFPSRDGTEIEAFVIKPPGFEESSRYPTLLSLHGGPVEQFDFRFTFEEQLMAANGYVVVMPNPRGSSGYGQAFSLGIWQSWGEKDTEDVLAGIDYVIQRGYADPERLGVFGWSYGGILTNYVITKTDRFKGAVTGASETLYIANYGHDQYQRWWELELGLPWENRELWERISPFNNVEKIVTPTLIMGGEIDWNVPINNSELLYQALRRLGRTTQLVVYPDEYHEISRPIFIKDVYQRHLDWFAKYVKGEKED